MLYDRPVRVLLQECVRHMPPVFTRQDAYQWFIEHYPLVKEGTVSAHLTAATVNSPSRQHYPHQDQELLCQLDSHRFEMYGEARHGRWSHAGQPLDDRARSVEVTELPITDPSAGSTMTGAQFEAHARSVLSEVWGIDLMPGDVRLADGLTKRFDLVSPDGTVVGDAKYYKALATPAAKWSTISEYVWLLQHVPGTGRRFLVFGNSRDVPQRWLDRFAPIATGVAFYFLEGDSLTTIEPNG